MIGVVAIIGSPNVGKSTIFNRIVGRRRAIVDDQPGVTRDRLYENAEWLDREFRIIDTGGIEIANRPFQEQIRMQAQLAIDEADVILFVVDGKKGLSNDDRMVAKLLYKCKKPVILSVNKIDNNSNCFINWSYVVVQTYISLSFIGAFDRLYTIINFRALQYNEFLDC